MGKDVIIYDEIYDILEIYNICGSMLSENIKRFNYNIKRLKELEQKHCKNDPTYYDYEKVLESLVEKENAAIYEAERLIAISALRKGLTKCD